MRDFITCMLMITLFMPKFVYMNLRDRFVKVIVFMLMGVQVGMSMLIHTMNMAMCMEKALDNSPVLFIHFSLVKHIMEEFMGSYCKGEVKTVQLKHLSVIEYL